jgi:hypothetical protein
MTVTLAPVHDDGEIEEATESSGSQVTPRRREMDSNFRFRARQGFGSEISLLGPPSMISIGGSRR